MGRRNYKLLTSTVSLTDALSTYQDVENLRDEMVEWRDNLDGAGMDHMPKYEEVSECCDVLDCYDELQSDCEELEQMLEGTDLAGVMVTSQDMQPYKGRGFPRWMQMSNALAPIRAACEHLTSQEAEDNTEALTDIIAKAAEVEAHCETLEGAEFPGMF